MERILVTGGLGFIGSRLCAALLDAGYTVSCVDDLSGAYAPGTGPAAATALAARGAEVAIARAHPAHVAGMDAVIHLAALPGVRTPRAGAELRETNVLLTARLARAAGAEGARFVFASSSSVYGDAAVLPTPEHAPMAPLNPYAASKVAAEGALRHCGADAVVVRPFTVYGPGQRPEMAFARWLAAIAAGEPLPWHAPAGAARDFTYVDDAVAGFLAALRHGRPGGAYNVSGWRAVELRAAMELMGAGELRALPSSAAEARVTSGCGRRASGELGYAPRVDIAAGVARQVAAAATGAASPGRPPGERGQAPPVPSRSGSGSRAGARGSGWPRPVALPAAATSRG